MVTDETAATLDDGDLLARLAVHNEGALAALYDRHGGVAFALALRVVGDRESAEEVVQEAFLSVWRAAGTYRPERGAVRTWLLSVVRNRGIDVVRARAARPRTTTTEDLVLTAEDDPEHAAISSIAGAAVRDAVAALPADQRAAVELAYFGGLTSPEIAARLGVPVGTVKSRLRLALERLRARLADLQITAPSLRTPAC